MAITLYLLTSTARADALVGLGVVAVGVVLYFGLALRQRSAGATLLLSRPLMAQRARARQDRFLGHSLLLIRRVLRALRSVV